MHPRGWKCGFIQIFNSPNMLPNIGVLTLPSECLNMTFAVGSSYPYPLIPILLPLSSLSLSLSSYPYLILWSYILIFSSYPYLLIPILLSLSYPYHLILIFLILILILVSFSYHLILYPNPLLLSLSSYPYPLILIFLSAYPYSYF